VTAAQKLAGAGVKQLAAQAKRRMPHAPPKKSLEAGATRAAGVMNDMLHSLNHTLSQHTTTPPRPAAAMHPRAD
jgi:hypothetical protein